MVAVHLVDEMRDPRDDPKGEVDLHGVEEWPAVVRDQVGLLFAVGD